MAKFGTGQLTKETPKWAIWMFRITFMLTTAATGYIAATNLLPEHAKYEATLFLKLLIDPLVFGLSKMFGVEIQSSENNEQ